MDKADQEYIRLLQKENEHLRSTLMQLKGMFDITVLRELIDKALEV